MVDEWPKYELKIIIFVIASVFYNISSVNFTFYCFVDDGA